MKIGELARTTGLTTKTIRFYEATGLLPRPPRTPSGYRVYGPEEVRQLEFIRQAKRLGLSLEDVRGVLQLHDRKEPSCVHVRSLLDGKLAQVDRALQDLREFRGELARLRDRAGTTVDCRPSGGRICGIIEKGIHTKGEVALTWLEGRRKGGLGGRVDAPRWGAST